jgi:hypothetical protein
MGSTVHMQIIDHDANSLEDDGVMAMWQFIHCSDTNAINDPKSEEGFAGTFLLSKASNK